MSDPSSVPVSSLAPVDRRGLGEVVTWASILVCLTLITCVVLVLQAAHNQPIEIPNTILGIISGVVTAFIARGTQGAVERSGSSDAFNAAASSLRNTLDEHHQQMAMMRSDFERMRASLPAPQAAPTVIPTGK